MSYETPKAKDYGVNFCEGCLNKQREIDRLKEEVPRLRLKVSANQRKSKAGFFGSSTPSSQVPVKQNSLAQNQAKRGGASGALTLAGLFCRESRQIVSMDGRCGNPGRK